MLEFTTLPLVRSLFSIFSSFNIRPFLTSYSWAVERFNLPYKWHSLRNVIAHIKGLENSNKVFSLILNVSTKDQRRACQNFSVAAAAQRKWRKNNWNEFCCAENYDVPTSGKIENETKPFYYNSYELTKVIIIYYWKYRIAVVSIFGEFHKIVVLVTIFATLFISTVLFSLFYYFSLKYCRV